MRYAIFSDVHSNLEAFNCALKYYAEERIDSFIFLGDIVGYGADPKEVISLLKKINPICIAGNHDWAVLDKLDINFFNEYARESILWTKKKLGEKENNYLSGFNLDYQEENFFCIHGSLDNPESFNYILGINDARVNFELLKKQILFVGHSHRPQIYYANSKGVFYHPQNDILIKTSEKYIINVGSIGQPRDRDNRLSLCLYDSEEKSISIKRLKYNIKDASDKIIKAGLPAMLAARLFVGY